MVNVQNKTSNTNARNVTTTTNRGNKEKVKIMNWITLLIATFGAFGGLASVKMTIDHYKPIEIKGKIISRYHNINKEKTQTYLLYKVSFLFLNKPLNLMKIYCEIEDQNGKKFTAPAANTRFVQFGLSKREDLKKLIDGQLQVLTDVPHTLLVSANEFLSNTSFLPENENIVGYLYFIFDGNLDFKWRSTTFVFESFDGKIKKLKIEETSIKPDDLFYDDTIWQPIETEE